MADTVTTLLNAATVAGPSAAVTLASTFSYLIVEFQGPFVADIAFEAQVADIWVPVPAHDVSEPMSFGEDLVKAVGDEGAAYRVRLDGFAKFRLNVRAYTSGAITAKTLTAAVA